MPADLIFWAVVIPAPLVIAGLIELLAPSDREDVFHSRSNDSG
jgi:hypothetical protein